MSVTEATQICYKTRGGRPGGHLRVILERGAGAGRILVHLPHTSGGLAVLRILQIMLHWWRPFLLFVVFFCVN